MDSLTIHQRRTELVGTIKRELQSRLSTAAPDTFRVSNVIIRSVTTDPSIEKAIRLAVEAQKMLEQKDVQTQIAKKDAEIRITEAHGIAESNRIINATLTREYLQHEQNNVMQAFAEREGGGKDTVIIPSNMTASPLINVR